MAAVDDDRWEDLPMDLLTEILLRLPPISGRRRVRLVCSRWRDAVDELEPETTAHSRAKPLTFLKRSVESGRPATARVFDDLAGGGLGGSREIWNGGESRSSPDIVGTCNGLLCLMQRGGEITLVNPVTGESLAIPPPPPPPRCRNHTAAAPEAERLSFSYHPLTGRYSIVHFPAAFCYGGGDNLADPAVEVLTLGGAGASASWREVAAPPGSRCCLPSRIVSVDGATYWVTKVDARIMSLDHEHERVTPVPPLQPAIAGELDGGLPASQRSPEGWESPSPPTIRRLPPSTITSRTSVATGDVVKGTLVEEFVIDPENVKMFSVINPEINVRMFSYVETNEPLNIYKEVCMDS
ncbi:hypothetical protein OsI_38386 [Oryza sativa Indica Group]|uniref:F-box domain-containing protein n=1 Tax=Oryza sativa subsp. indica TaxID=39946 RepID=B8BPQ9_ORYSI|nr:hypothetical protein OsI_38386 [Oryza sativa Indica Group]